MKIDTFDKILFRARVDHDDVGGKHMDLRDVLQALGDDTAEVPQELQAARAKESPFPEEGWLDGYTGVDGSSWQGYTEFYGTSGAQLRAVSYAIWAVLSYYNLATEVSFGFAAESDGDYGGGYVLVNSSEILIAFSGDDLETLLKARKDMRDLVACENLVANGTKLSQAQADALLLSAERHHKMSAAAVASASFLKEMYTRILDAFARDQCPFSAGDTILVPKWESEETTRCKIVSIHGPYMPLGIAARVEMAASMGGVQKCYSLQCVKLKKDGTEAKNGHMGVMCNEALEKANLDFESPDIREIWERAIARAKD